MKILQVITRSELSGAQTVVIYDSYSVVGLEIFYQPLPILLL